MSYIKNKNILVKKILLATTTNTKTTYKNIWFILNFTYLDFKLWLIQQSNKDNNTNETKLDFSNPLTTIYFKIHPIDISTISSNLQPKTVDKYKFIREIITDIDTDIITKWHTQ